MLNKRYIVYLSVFAIVQTAVGNVFTTVYLPDANTPLEIPDANNPFTYRDIMVGTKLPMVVSSDMPGMWEGSLLISGTDRDFGVLSGRNLDGNEINLEDSCLEAAGAWANVYQLYDYLNSGLSLYVHRDAIIGEWFIVDYTAMQTGTCHVGFYDYNISWTESIYELTFNHVPTRDFNLDTIVDFHDFAVFASCWQTADSNDVDLCEQTDLNTDGGIDVNDLSLFSDFWLERTEIAMVDPNSSDI